MVKLKKVVHNKVVHDEFKLTTVAGRVGLLGGITAGTVGLAEVKAAMLQDTEKRPYRKPVVAYGKRYRSISEAAEDLCGWGASYNDMAAMRAHIRSLCNEDKTVGFYWSE